MARALKNRILKVIIQDGWEESYRNFRPHLEESEQLEKQLSDLGDSVLRAYKNKDVKVLIIRPAVMNKGTKIND